MRKILILCTLLFVSALPARGLMAQPGVSTVETAPDVLVRAVAEEVSAIIREDPDTQIGTPGVAAEMIERSVLPLFNFSRMTQLASARSWRYASAAQKAALTREFRVQIVRSYASVLSNHRDQVMEFKRLGATPDSKYVTVKSLLGQPGMVPMTVDYEMELTESGWMVYDIKVVNISLVTIHRATFAAMVRERGIEGLITALAEQNRPTEASTLSPNANTVRLLGVLVRGVSAASAR